MVCFPAQQQCPGVATVPPAVGPYLQQWYLVLVGLGWLAAYSPLWQQWVAVELRLFGSSSVWAFITPFAAWQQQWSVGLCWVLHLGPYKQDCGWAW